MQFGLTETQQVLKNSAREFFSAECPIAEVRRLMETRHRLRRGLVAEDGAPGLDRHHLR